MNTDLTHMLQQWQAQPDLEWVLATLVSVKGSSYRKPGAMMLINSLGKYYGMLSGGCLEADIMLKASRTMDDGRSRTLLYDMSDEDDLAFQLGIGCGGRIEILLQAVNAKNHHLQFPQLLKRLQAQQTCYYLQALDDQPSASELMSPTQFDCHRVDEQQWFVQALKPNPHIAIFGGGLDAQPLVSIASQLGWQITLCDPRSAYAREDYFPKANTIHKKPIEALTGLKAIDAAIVMHHNIPLDAQALLMLLQSDTAYIGLLGPSHRTQRVLQAAQLSPQQWHQALAEQQKTFASPIGLNLGGDTPEAIALAIVSEVQAFLSQRDGRSFSQALKQEHNL